MTTEGWGAGGTRSIERRRHLAIKWHMIDGIPIDELPQKFEDAGFKKYEISTIKNYLKEGPTDEVIEQLEQKHAEVRMQIAEREEQMFRRARKDEEDAVQDVDKYALRPDEETNTGQEPIDVPAWRVLDEAEKPSWADEDDLLIEFDDEATVVIQPTQSYYECTLDREPQYHKELVEVEHEVPDRVGRQYARNEQTEHLRNKGEILGAYEQNINVDADVTQEVQLDPDQAEAVRDALKTYDE